MVDVMSTRLVQSLAGRHERVLLVQEPTSGLRAVIAIHSTALGPALGGLRLRAYPGGLSEALDDALRLSRAMTLKSSAAGLDLGGGKAVILDDGRSELRWERLSAFAEELERLGGAYITAEDIGTTMADMDFLAHRTPHVVGRTEHDGVGGDLSPDTARTVLGAMRAALAALDGSEDLDGRTVGVVGVGKVGGQLAEWLVQSGAQVVAYDPNPAAVARLAAAAPEVEFVPTTHELLSRELDVLSPCATGGLIDADVAGSVRCRIVCGAANNPLADDALAMILAHREVLYVPDFIANCGGVVCADFERRGVADPAPLAAAIARAKDRAAEILAESRAGGRLPVQVAEAHAWERVERARLSAGVA